MFIEDVHRKWKRRGRRWVRFLEILACSVHIGGMQREMSELIQIYKRKPSVSPESDSRETPSRVYIRETSSQVMNLHAGMLFLSSSC